MKLLDVAAVAEMLGISHSLVYKLVERGKLAHFRIGAGRGAIRVSEAEVAQYLESCRRDSKTEESPRQAPRLKVKHVRL